jgi:NADH-quinone oxidoreductase subunit F
VEAYRAVGTEDSPGTKLFCLSGDVERPGVYETPFGLSLQALVDMAGGVKGELQAVLIGGAAGTFASPRELHLEMSFEGLRDGGHALGSGVVMVMNTNRDMGQTLLSIAEIFAHESCGKCYPCRLGTQRQLEIMQRVVQGRASRGDLVALEDIEFAMRETSICGLGVAAGTALISAYQRWPAVFGRGEAQG